VQRHQRCPFECHVRKIGPKITEIDISNIIILEKQNPKTKMHERTVIIYFRFSSITKTEYAAKLISTIRTNICPELLFSHPLIRASQQEFCLLLSPQMLVKTLIPSVPYTP
jgi:hypothetical protein